VEEYYEVLGLKPGATQAEIKNAYRKLAKVWHPDRFPNDPELQKKGAEQFRKINEAFEKLKAFRPSSADPAAYSKQQETRSRKPREAHWTTSRQPEGSSSHDERVSVGGPSILGFGASLGATFPPTLGRC